MQAEHQPVLQMIKQKAIHHTKIIPVFVKTATAPPAFVIASIAYSV
jgi:hypothetical protein